MSELNVEESEVVEYHIPCPNKECGSSNGASLYSDGHIFCFVCRKVSGGDPSMSQQPSHSKRKKQPIIPFEDLESHPIKSRGLQKDTCVKFGYFISNSGGKPVQVANYLNEDGDVSGQKIRWADKILLTFGSIADIFYGQWLFGGGGKKLIVTEGEIDCLTVSQVFGNKYPVVSIPKGSGSALKTFKAQLKFLELFEEVVVCFDMDTAGREAVQSIKGILSPGKLKIAELPLKDPNEMLLAGRSEELVRAIWNATEYKPDGIINGNTLFEKIEGLSESTMGTPLPWDILLNYKIKGLRKAEITLVTAGSGIGKTTMVRAIAHNFGTIQGLRIGCLFLEETPARTAQGLMSCTARLPLHLQNDLPEDERLSFEARKEVFEKTLGSGNFIFYDHFGSIEGDNLISQMRYMAVSETCDFLILDHISIAVSGLEGDNDVKVLDRLMTQLASLTQETGVGIILISHLRKKDGKGKSHEEGGKVTLDDLRGSGALKQLSFTIIALERNQQDEDDRMKHVISVKVLKCRHTGDTGYAGYLHYNRDTDELEAIEDLEEFLGGESIAEPMFSTEGVGKKSDF